MALRNVIGRIDAGWIKTLACRNILDTIDPEHLEPRSVQSHGRLCHLAGHTMIVQLVT